MKRFGKFLQEHYKKVLIHALFLLLIGIPLGIWLFSYRVDWLGTVLFVFDLALIVPITEYCIRLLSSRIPLDD